jgi:glycosyltransferase involved in cell wall biosynthesis
VVSLKSLLLGPELAVLHEFHRPPYGGGNQFLLALVGEWRRRGLDVGKNRVGRRTRALLFNSYNFDAALLAPGGAAQRRVHRVDGPIGLYRGSDDRVDRELCELNRRHAHATVFQSSYSLEQHRALGLEFVSPSVIPNAVDPEIFHPRGRLPPPDAARKLRVISTSWSDNPNKGGPAYKRLEGLLDFERVEYTFVGRAQVAFERLRARPPVASRELAELLRQHDVYVTASLHDPCSNALIEALACGLPALYAKSGGHAELAGEAGFGFDDVEQVPDLLRKVSDDYVALQSRIRTPLLPDVADRYLAVLGMRGAS